MSQEVPNMPQQAQKQKLNGVDVGALNETVEAIKGKPDLAKFRFRAENKWVDCGRNKTTIKGFYGAGEEHTHKTPFVLDADEPEALLGGGTAAGPGDFVLVALASCIATSVAYHAAARGISVESVESSLEGNIDLRGFLGLSEETHNGFEDISVKLKIKSDASPEQLEELANLSPVLDTLTRAVPVKINVEKS